MKKILLATGIAALAFVSVAAAAGYTFSTNLTVGSRGSDVSALQSWLMSQGYSIPAGATGYFGSQTQSAVKQYQTSQGLPSTGFVGPLTRAKLNGSGLGSNVGACPIAGWTQASYNGTTFCVPPGYSAPGVVPVTPPVNNNPGSITTPGIAGTLAVSLQSTPSNGTSVDKGQSADVVRYKLQAGASDMQVNSIALDFDNRFWLYASGLTIKDEAGNVVASKTGLTQNDFTELTVGSDYRIYVPLNFVVARAATKYITVNVQMLPVTDRSAATLSVTQAQVRAVDGTTVTDTETVSGTRTFSYTGSNNGQVVVTLDSASPLKRLVQVSTSAITNDVPIAVYDIKSQNKDGNLRTFKVTLQTTGASGSGGPAASTIFQDVRIKAGNLVYSADSVASTTTFTNLQIPLPKDQYVPVTILVNVSKDTSNVFDGVSASTTLTANTTNVAVEDSTFNTVSVNSGTFISSDAIFSASSATLSNLSATLGSPVQQNNSVVTYPISMSFTVTAGDNTLYIASNPNVALSTTSSGVGTASTTLSDVTANPGTIAGDNATSTSSNTAYYVIPAGSSRTFTYNGSINNTNGTSGLKTVKITAVNYGTASTALTANTITYNLDALKVTPTF